MEILEFVRRRVQRQIQSMPGTTGLLISKDQETRKLKEKGVGGRKDLGLFTQMGWPRKSRVSFPISAFEM